MKRRMLAALGVLAGFVFIFGVIKMQPGSGGKTDITDYHEALFGENVYVFSPEDDPAEVKQILEELYDRQETNQFGDERYAIYFMPGEYDEAIQPEVGFYTQVSGLGILPTDTKIQGLSCLARWLGDDESNHNACCNFWRSVENVSIESNTVWAVSQATDMRRVNIEGALYLHDDYGWCSGGFLADSNITRLVDSGSQQQWLSRNDNWGTWMGENWNMVFVGEEKGSAPEGTWPVKAYTTVDTTDVVREKPFLVYDEKHGYGIYVPKLQTNSYGTTWLNLEASDALWTDKNDGDASSDVIVGIDAFYIADATKDTAETMNEALKEGKNLLLTPGIYEIDQPIEINNPNTIVLGMGLATTVVLVMSNMIISLLRKVIPDGVRMPAYIVIVASFVTIVQMILQAYVTTLYDALGLYIPLIVVNCIILGRAESYASKNKVIPSIFDGLGMGLGFTLGLTSIGIVRELIGTGKIFNLQLLPKSYEGVSIFILAPGAFLVLAFLCALQNKFGAKGANRHVKDETACGGDCMHCNSLCKEAENKEVNK